MSPVQYFHLDPQSGEYREPEVPATSPTILLVEDNPTDVRLIREALEEHAVRCKLVLITDGERAVQFIEAAEDAKTGWPNLSIVDLSLPKKSGMDVLRSMGQTSKYHGVPVVVLTSSDREEDREESAHLGASRYIQKPSRLADFMRLGSLFKEMLGAKTISNLSTDHSHDDDLELYVRGRLEPEHQSVVEGHLSQCLNCRERLAQCLGVQFPLNYTGKTEPDRTHERLEPRFTTGDDAFFQELNPLSLQRQMVRIVDVSKHGLGVLAAKAVFPGTIVQIRIKSNVELAEVRHCSALGDNGYRIGLRLHS
jgi:CheY-like chemotaxis protein